METKGNGTRGNLASTLSIPTDRISRRDFPEDFIFGTATSAYQIEGAADDGGKGPSIWDTFTQKNPGKIKEGANGNLAVNSYKLYKEDVQILKKLGLDAYRFSIAWSRILPGGKLSMGVNKQGINFYNDLINELIANGIEPYVTLFHWDLPNALEEEYHGFLSPRVVSDFCDFAEVCFWEFGDRVKNWITFNESWTYCQGGYVLGSFAPGRGAAASDHVEGTVHPSRCHLGDFYHCNHGDPGTEPYIVAHNQLLAHAAAVELYRKYFQVSQKGKIGITLVSQWYEPLNPNNPTDVAAAKRGLDFMFGWFMSPLVTGDYPQSMRQYVGSRLPTFTEEEVKKVKGSYDFLGLNYYTGTYTSNNPNPPTGKPSYATDSQLLYATERDGKPIGQQAGSSWLYIYPEGFYKLMVYVKQTYNSPIIYITENGVDEVNDNTKTLSEARLDQMRIDYHRDHLFALQQAIDDGVNVKGYFTWSFMDNFEWGEGYNVRFGMIFVDYKNNMARYPKTSAIWFRDFLTQGKQIFSPRGKLIFSPRKRLAESQAAEAVKKTKK